MSEVEFEKIEVAVFHAPDGNSFIIPGYMRGHEKIEYDMTIDAMMLGICLGVKVEWRKYDYDSKADVLNVGVVRKSILTHPALRHGGMDVLIVAGPHWDEAPETKNQIMIVNTVDKTETVVTKQ